MILSLFFGFRFHWEEAGDILHAALVHLAELGLGCAGLPLKNRQILLGKIKAHIYIHQVTVLEPPKVTTPMYCQLYHHMKTVNNNETLTVYGSNVITLLTDHQHISWTSPLMSKNILWPEPQVGKFGLIILVVHLSIFGDNFNFSLNY